MDQRRFVAFLILAFLILLANEMLSHSLRPPPEQPKVAKVDPPAPPGKEPADEQDGPEEAPDEPVEDLPEERPVVVPEKSVPDEWVTLGSADAASPYRMLVTLTNRGAAVERLELSSDRYRDLEDRSGYLGHLAPIDAPGGGSLVRVVGAGTPAARGGLAPGDVITAVGKSEITSAEELHRVLSTTKAGQEIALTITRPGEGEPIHARVELGRRPLEVLRPERDNLRVRKEKIPPGFDDPPSLLLTLEQLGDKRLSEVGGELEGVDLIGGNWEIVEHNASEVTFRRYVAGAGLEVIKRYRLAKVPPEHLNDETYKAYHLEFDVELHNIGRQTQQVAYRLDGPNGLPIEGWWYSSKISRNWGGVGMRDLVLRYEGQAAKMFACASVAEGEVEPMGQGQSLTYVGVDAQYFSAMIIPRKEQLSQVWFAETKGLLVGPEPDARADLRLSNITCRLTSKVESLPPDGRLTHSFHVFAGPKKPDLLANYHQEANPVYGLSDLVYYGWFSWVAQTMLVILHGFYAVVHNYGIAIILLTVLVRGLMFPLSRRQAMNMAKMQELQPEMQRIQEKYKTDMEKRTKAQQELFRKNNYNPMGGCLLMFVQLPIFLGLYRSLMVDVELRQAPLISDAIRWCSNLSAPDMLFDWSGFMPEFITKGTGIFVLGPYFNILPLITVVLFLWQQKMFMPPAVNEQAAMQQKIMKYMMVFIGIMFYKVASGLCLYFIASTAWGMAERKLLPKVVTASGQVATPAKPPAKNGAAGASRSDGKKSKGRPRQKKR